jgi:predicted phosphodiesterase
MRIAILSDLHGNLPAFEAALDHARKHKPDAMVIAGDTIIGSPDSAACWQLARSLG